MAIFCRLNPTRRPFLTRATTNYVVSGTLSVHIPRTLLLKTKFVVGELEGSASDDTITTCDIDQSGGASERRKEARCDTFVNLNA